MTITVSDEVYQGLYSRIGHGRISRFLDALARPHVVEHELEPAYKTRAHQSREAEALEWMKNLAPDVAAK